MKDANNETQTLDMEIGSIPRSYEILHTPGKKRYFPPELKQQAHLRDITLGPSYGLGESTAPYTRKAGPDSMPNSDEKSDSSSGFFDNDIFD